MVPPQVGLELSVELDSDLDQLPATLDFDVRKPDTGVMNSDSASAAGDQTFGGLFGPPSPLPVTATSRDLPLLPDASTLASTDASDLADLLQELISARRREDPEVTAHGERHVDGSLRVPSLEAVWLLTQLGKSVGVRRLVNLRNVQVSRLRSLRGIAEIAIDAVWSLGYIA